MITPASIRHKKRTPNFEAFTRAAVVAARPISKFSIRKLALVATALGLLCASSAGLAEEPVNLGVSIPAATHSFTGGIVFWANEAKKELEKAHPGLKITVKTAGSAPEQANQLQDLLTVSKINTLVIFPFESASLTKPVAQLKNKGVYVTVVDRGLTDTSAQDAYVAGDNTAFGKVAGRVPGQGPERQGQHRCRCAAFRPRSTTSAWTPSTPCMKNYPDIKMLDAKHGNWNRDDAFKVMQDYLTRFKKIDAVWAADDDMAVGVLKAIEQAKRNDIKIVFGGAGAKGCDQDADGRQATR